MRDILEFAERCSKLGQRFAIAVVTHTWGSSPRPVGSMMAVSEDGAIAGSVSGGCVEGAVIEAAHRVMASGLGETLSFDQLNSEDIWSVGLSCGGKIEVLVTLPDKAWIEAFEMARRRERFFLYVGENEAVASARTIRRLRDEAGRFEYEHRRPERLIVVGGVHIAVPLLGLARQLGFETVLIEPRPQFASPERFPSAPDQILGMWPAEALAKCGVDEETYAVLLTHDPKIDDAALRILLRSPVRYIGALGSRTTQAQRRERLLGEGFTEGEIGRIHGPIGLPIGAKTPEEIAVSVIAEMVQVRRAS